MANIRREAVNAAYDKAYALINNDDMHKRFKEIKEFVNNDETLSKEEKLEVIKRFDGDYDYFKVVKNDGIKRDCENCGYSDIYTADWEDGCYKEWDLEEKKLKRSGTSKVALKRLETIEGDNKTWLEEALYISNKWGSIVQCYDINKSIHENNDNWKDVNIDINPNITELTYNNSKVYTFKDLPKPKNATKDI
ncbi:uncharacterized protein OCT59_012457 [Rhizophagus irregularis]|uniref:uncharacterized protein n=1 Tax=Rhizophagus irregularis TaxID=588596 RepID=UPI00331E3342|nr:hypothetical protein OCT59_012457 [Rhizophagus irregularis]